MERISEHHFEDGVIMFLSNRLLQSEDQHSGETHFDQSYDIDINNNNKNYRNLFMKGWGSSNSDNIDNIPDSTPKTALWICLLPLAFCIIVFCIGTIIDFYYDYRREVLQSAIQSGKKKKSLEKRREKLSKKFQKYGNEMVVTKKRLKDEEDNIMKGDIEDIYREDGYLMLTKKDENGEEMKVPNNCVICFEPYKESDVVVWSTGKMCPHVYHEACFIEYMVTFKGEGRPCPTCRQPFCDFSAIKTTRR